MLKESASDSGLFGLSRLCGHLVYLVHRPDERNEPNKPDKRNRRDKPDKPDKPDRPDKPVLAGNRGRLLEMEASYHAYCVDYSSLN